MKMDNITNIKPKGNLWVIGHHIKPIETSGQYDMVIGETPAGVPGPPPHYHRQYAELFFVLEGILEFMVGEEKQVIQPGESINLPPNTVHTFSNAGQGICKWLNLHSPKGFLSFFKDFGVDATIPDAVQSSSTPEMIEKVLQNAADYDMHIVS